MKTIAPMEPGSLRTILSVDAANTLVDGAAAIKSFRGGYGVGVTHSQAGIRVDLKNGTTFNELFLNGCPNPATYSVNESFTYHYTNASHTSLKWPPTATTGHPEYDADLTVSDSYQIAATEVFKLSDYFPYQVFQDNGSSFGRVGSIVQSYYPQTGVPSGGTFTLTISALHNGSVVSAPVTTSAIAYNASALKVSRILNALAPVIYVGGVTVSSYSLTGISGSGDAWFIEYVDGVRHGPNFADYLFISSNATNLQKGGGSIGYLAHLPNIYSYGVHYTKVTNQWRDHPSGSLTIGPYDVRMIVFSATKLEADDALYYSKSGAAEVEIPCGVSIGGMAHNTPIVKLNPGESLRIRCIDSGGAYILASGYIGVKPYACCPPSWQNQMSQT